MGEENKKTNNQVVTTVKESKTNHEKSNKVFYGDGKQVLPVGVLDYNDFFGSDKERTENGRI